MNKNEILSRNFQSLLGDIKRRPLVLFVGAGINGGIIPMWSCLLKELLEYTAEKIINMSGQDLSLKSSLLSMVLKLSTYEQASLAKIVLGKQYFSYLRSRLYVKYIRKTPHGPDFHYEKICPKDGTGPCLLQRIIPLCKNRKVTAVVSYNYDDILLNAINAQNKRRAVSICGEKGTATVSPGDLPIYYVHGFIPCKGRLPSLEESMMVLSRDEYFRIMLEPYSWQTTVQLHFLQNSVCLFLGTSLSDWNMMRMLSTAKIYSPLNSVYTMTTPGSDTAKQKKNNPPEENLHSLLARVKATLFDDLGVKPIFTNKNDYLEINKMLARLNKEVIANERS